MKNLIISSCIAVLFFSACSNNKAGNENSLDTSKVTAKKRTAANPLSPVLSAYFNIQSALAKDDDQGAATAGKAIEAAFAEIDTTILEADLQKTLAETADDAKEHGEHIGANEGNIAHQREHFEGLSKDIYLLVKSSTESGKLYAMHCPMYNRNKGADWISKSREVTNPYLGKSMLTCGSVKEEIN